MKPDGDARLLGVARLLEVIDRLRDPGGCPWDREQSLESMAHNLLEEAYEVADAMLQGDRKSVCQELGDLLMNILLSARIAEDAGDFSLADVSRLITQKLVRRHPHVFGEVVADDVDAVLKNWEEIKSEERSEDTDRSSLAGVPAALPALLRAYRLGEKAARVGFKWPDRTGPLAKLDEELCELKQAIEEGYQDRIGEELGDVLFSVVNLARHLKIEPESALRRTTFRFDERFRCMERKLEHRLKEVPLERMEALWREAKREWLEPESLPSQAPGEWRRAVRRLMESRAALIATVSDLPEDLVQAAPEEPGAWSIVGVMEHLHLLERGLAVAMKKVMREAVEEPFPEEGLAAHPPKNRLIESGQKAEAPTWTVPSGGVSRAELLARLAQSREKLFALLPRLTLVNPRNLLLEHPRLGDLDALQWFEFLAWHERRHLRQIDSLRH
ncbi:MAG: nucleoside triphosphate pyrophosphohydrolase [Planctomycetota bacterium]